jgi:uncharacterized protein
MNKKQILQNTVDFVKTSLKNAEGGHDWFHVERVLKNALLIAQNERVDLFVVQLGALLHDVADAKFHNGDERIGPKITKKFLEKERLPSPIANHVVQIVKNTSFKGGNFEQNFNSLELQVVQDADRLDAIGAIGIARCFGYGGYKGRALYNPDIAPNLNMDKEAYKHSTAPSINHFYEKLLRLKDRMHTKTGRKIAEKRQLFMEGYLTQFFAEWRGEL